MNLNYERDREKLELTKLREQIRAFEQGNWQLVEKRNKDRARVCTWQSYLNFLAWFNH